MSATMRTGAQQLGRRDFLRTSAAVSGGLWISAWVPELASAAAKSAAAAGKVFAPNAFVRIAADESVTVIANHSEMGQGIYTSLPMLLNEELEADWSKITVEPAPVDAAYNHTVFGLQMTGGSTTTPSEWERFRRMGAMARVMLGATGQLYAMGDPTPLVILHRRNPDRFIYLGSGVDHWRDTHTTGGFQASGFDMAAARARHQDPRASSG